MHDLKENFQETKVTLQLRISNAQDSVFCLLLLPAVFQSCTIWILDVSGFKHNGFVSTTAGHGAVLCLSAGEWGQMGAGMISRVKRRGTAAF